MPEKQLSIESIRELVSGLTRTARAHAERCKLIAEFILTCPGSDRIFLKRMYSEKLLLAVGYHDFGKAFIPSTATEYKFCKKQSDKKAYPLHITKAEEYIKENSSIYSSDPASFDRFLLECATMHHESFDGTGFGRGIAERNIPLVARLCATVNFIEHTLDFENSGFANTEKVEAALEKAAGTLLDPRICKLVLRHSADFEALCKDMYEDFRRDPEGHSHLKIRYKVQRDTLDYKNIGYETVVSLFDSNYGEVPMELVRVSAKDAAVVKLDKIMRQRIFSQMEALNEKGVDCGRITIRESAQSLRRSDYPSQLSRLLTDYGIDAGKLTVAVPEELLYTEPPEIFDRLKAVKKLGVRLAIDDFGELYKTFEVFEGFRFDEVRLSTALINKLDENDTFQIVAGMVSVARNLSIDVACSEINSVEDESLLAGMGVNILSGILYGAPVRAEEIENVKVSAGDAYGE